MWLCRGTSPSSDYYIDVSPAPSNVKSSSTITITCYEDSNLSVAIPSQVKWTRTHQGWSKKLSDLSHAYVCKPTDIGSIIEAEVTARSGNSIERNSFTIKFGPVRLDPLIRPTLESVIKNSIASFAVSIVSPYKTKEYVLHITDADLEIKDARTGSNIKSTYSAIQPQFIQSTSDPCSVTMMIPKQNQSDYERFFSISQIQKDIETLKQKDKRNSKQKQKQSSLKIRFNDRQSRDLFVIARKAFVVKRETRLISIIQNSLDTPISNNNPVDLLIQMSTVKALNQYLSRKKQLYKNQVDILQEEIENVKNIYQGLLKQKSEPRTQQKPKFDPMLSLLDSSNNSKQVIGGAGHSRSIPGQVKQGTVKLSVIGEVSEIKNTKVNVSQNVMYSQVYPFNESISKKVSQEIHQKVQIGMKRYNTISQKSRSDSQSILNSSHSHHQNKIKEEKYNSSLDQIQKQMQQRNKEELYNAWREEAHKNLVLQSRVNQLQKQLILSNKIDSSSYIEGQQFLVRENDQLSKLVKQKDGVIKLLVAEGNNLKLQLDNVNLLKQKYKEKCDTILKSNVDPVAIPSDIQSPEQFYQRLQPYQNQSDKLMRESKRLNSMIKLAFSQEMHHPNHK